jgi:predicted ABC-type sugar transport system permease subunit
MNKNMGTADRAIRIIVAIVIGFLYFTGRIGGLLGIILGIVAIVFVVTSFMARCPAYGPLGISTCKKPDGT